MDRTPWLALFLHGAFVLCGVGAMSFGLKAFGPEFVLLVAIVLFYMLDAIRKMMERK